MSPSPRKGLTAFDMPITEKPALDLVNFQEPMVKRDQHRIESNTEPGLSTN